LSAQFFQILQNLKKLPASPTGKKFKGQETKMKNQMKNQFERIEDSFDEQNAESVQLIKMELTSRFFGEHSAEEAGNWNRDYSEKVDQILSDNPEMLSSYTEDKEAIIKKIENMLYGEEELDKAA
jgi:hypothetical protein